MLSEGTISRAVPNGVDLRSISLEVRDNDWDERNTIKYLVFANADLSRSIYPYLSILIPIKKDYGKKA